MANVVGAWKWTCDGCDWSVRWPCLMQDIDRTANVSSSRMSSSGQCWPASIVMHVAAAAVEQAAVNCSPVDNRLVLATEYLALYCRKGQHS
jgi:hypothetical protein